mmetsp:Transcript_14620/g.62683  ORF Transcript_14620/g.62683 Transcript_14620/m.62683 type:complete len:262 (+) Transcript_14620:1635-2420(+)
MYPTLPPSMRDATGSDAETLRRSVTTRVFSSSLDRTPTATSASALAWIKDTAWNADLFLVATPSTETSSSPCLTPARAAGESSTKPSTRRREPSSASSAMFSPTPLMSYLSRGANAAGSTNRENGSPSVRRMSRMTSYASARVTGGCFVYSSRKRAHRARSKPSAARAGRKFSSTTFHTSSTICRSVAAAGAGASFESRAAGAGASAAASASSRASSSAYATGTPPVTTPPTNAATAEPEGKPSPSSTHDAAAADTRAAAA